MKNKKYTGNGMFPRDPRAARQGVVLLFSVGYVS